MGNTEKITNRYSRPLVKSELTTRKNIDESIPTFQGTSLPKKKSIKHKTFELSKQVFNNLQRSVWNFNTAYAYLLDGINLYLKDCIDSLSKANTQAEEEKDNKELQKESKRQEKLFKEKIKILEPDNPEGYFRISMTAKELEKYCLGKYSSVVNSDREHFIRNSFWNKFSKLSLNPKGLALYVGTKYVVCQPVVIYGKGDLQKPVTEDTKNSKGGFVKNLENVIGIKDKFIFYLWKPLFVGVLNPSEMNYLILPPWLQATLEYLKQSEPYLFYYQAEDGKTTETLSTEQVRKYLLFMAAHNNSFQGRSLTVDSIEFFSAIYPRMICSCKNKDGESSKALKNNAVAKAMLQALISIHYCLQDEGIVDGLIQIERGVVFDQKKHTIKFHLKTLVENAPKKKLPTKKTKKKETANEP